MTNAELADELERLTTRTRDTDSRGLGPMAALAILVADNASMILSALRSADALAVRPTESALDHMQSHGGSFVRALAECYGRADNSNRKLLAESGISKWFAEYNAIAERAAQGTTSKP